MQIHNAAITGSFTYNGVDISDITGSEQSVTSLNEFSSSILNYTSSNNTNISALNAQSASFLAYTASNDAKITSLNTFSSSILSYTSSANTKFAGLDVASGSAITRLDSLEVASGSAITRISALETASGSAITRLSSIENKTGSYATTGSNIFVDGQYLSSSFNPTGFSTTASLYTDGGLRVTRDAYISGTLYLNNITVFGTQSVAYISSSQLNIGTNLITVNTDTPSIRFGGLSVYDSGSTGLTGSILWDSQNNHWIYSNPSGSSYSGGMFISGPRTSTLGSETGTTSCMLMAGQGGDHITSSMIYHSSTVTCIPSALSTSGTATFNGCVNVNTGNQIRLYNSAKNNWVQIDSPLTAGDAAIDFKLTTQSGILYINNTGVACFNNAICAPRAELTSDASCVPLRLINGVITGGDTTGVTALYFGDAGSGVSMMQREKYAANQANLVLYSEYGYNTQSINACFGYNGVAFYTAGTKRQSIDSSGITCFSNTICAANLISSGQICSVGDNKNLDIGGVAVIRGNGSAYQTHYFTTGAANVASYYQYNASGTNTVKIAAGEHSYFNSGCNVGIGYSSPSFRLDVCSGDAQTARFTRYCAGTGNTNGQIAEFVNLATSGYSSYIYIGSSPGTDWKIGKNVTNCNGNYDFTIVDSSNFGRMRITPTGEVCFACQVCASRFISSDDFNIRNTLFSTTGTLSKLTWTNLYPSTYNVADIGVQLDGNYYNGAFVFRTADADNANVLRERLRIESRGVACFSNTICTPVLRASRVISNSTQLYDSDFSLNAGITRSVVLCGGIYTLGDFHLMVYGNAGTGMSSIRLSTYGYFANSNLLGFCEQLRYTFGSMTISGVSNNGTSISFNIGNCSGGSNGTGFWRMLSLNGDSANSCINVYVI
jgi:hypothetical protein